jgi:hypothetical protein
MVINKKKNKRRRREDRERRKDLFVDGGEEDEVVGVGVVEDSGVGFVAMFHELVDSISVSGFDLLRDRNQLCESLLDRPVGRCVLVLVL